jgi:tRNA (cmo5U34)-methyltransferase
MTNEWTKPDHALDYLRRLEEIPHRQEGEATLISEMPKHATRIMDLGCGNGHLLALLLATVIRPLSWAWILLQRC